MLLGILVPAEGSRLPNTPNEWNFLRTNKDTLLVFTPKGVNYQNQKVYGYAYKHQKRRWVKSILPIPDVIFNYSNTPYITNKALWRLTRGRIFNSHLWVSKWATGQQLKRAPKSLANVPPTYSLSHIDSMLSKWNSIYLKPTRRAQGRGVIQVGRQGSQYTYTFSSNKRRFRRFAGSTRGLKKQLKRVMGNDTYLIQKDIKLAAINGRKFDFRVLTFRRPDGTWEATGGYAKLARRGSAVTNLSQGADERSIKSILIRSFGRTKAQKIYYAMMKQAVQVSQYLASNYTHMAFFGHDFGVDKNGKVWFIEANALPGLSPAQKTIARAVWRYAKSLL